MANDNNDQGQQQRSPRRDETKTVVVKMKRGSYVGLGCPDPERRLREEDIGFGYTHDHPAVSKWKEIEERDDQGFNKTRHEYVDGERVQLYPPPEHERAEADKMKASDKRFSFSEKEALKRAKDMEKNGTAVLL